MDRIWMALLALPLGLATACGGYTAPTGSQNQPPPPALTNDIHIVVGASQLMSTAFNPNPKDVSLAGNASVTVRWVNGDISGGDYTVGTATSHNITPDTPGAFAPSGTLGGNATYSVTLTAGSYPYHCSIHPNMVGTVMVNP